MGNERTTGASLSPEDLAAISAALRMDVVPVRRAPDPSDRTTTMGFDPVSGSAEQLPPVLDEGLAELMEEPDADETKPLPSEGADDWVAVLTERLRDCPGVFLVAPDTTRQQVESKWTDAVFLVERAEGGFRWFQRGASGLGWVAAGRVVATYNDLLSKLRFANDLAAEVAKSTPPAKKAVSFWQHRAERLNDHLVLLMQRSTQRLHDDLCAEEFDLDGVAVRAADIAETLRVLAEA